jgi:Tol biopolymer transport system component
MHSAIRVRRAWIGGLLLLAGLLILLTSGRQSVSAQITDRSISAGGIIAYVTTNHEIWLSAPDGSNTRKLWEIPQEARANMISGLRDLSWNKDGSTLAFVSGHEPHCSWYETNIYVININGSGFRRITNRPTCAEASSMATGTITVNIRNDFDQIQIAEITVEGAPQPTFVSLLPRLSKQVTIPNVPDLGPGILQSVVAIEGGNRWWTPGVDVVAGQTVHAGELGLSAASRVSNVNVSDPTWSPDGQTIGFLLAGRLMQRVALNAGVLQRSIDLFSGDPQMIAASELAWSPVDDTVIFTANNTDGGRSIFRATVGSANAAVLLVNVDDTRGLSWLPDGSGFVMVNYFAEFFSPVNSNLWHIDLVNSQATQLTQFENEFAFHPTLSPDGQQIAFNYAPNLQPETPSEIRILPISGGNMTGFGPSNIAYAAWAPDGGAVDPTPTATPVPPTNTPVPPTATPTSPGTSPTATPIPPTATPVPGSSNHSIFLPYTVR